MVNFWHIWKKMQTKMHHALIFEHTHNFNAFSLLTNLLFQFPVPVKYSL